MNKFIEKKLLHFFTTGNIYEDFAAARQKKNALLRRVIRMCFYVHCAAAIVCIILAAVLGAGAGIIAVALCEVLLAGLAFLAVGDMMLMKILLCGADAAFTVAMFVTGALVEHKNAFITVGVITIFITLFAAAAFLAAVAKAYLESFSPLSIRREHYTLLPNLGGDLPADTSEEEAEPKIVLPPPRTEVQILSDRLREILCKPSITEKKDDREQAADVTERTEVLQ